MMDEEKKDQTEETPEAETPEAETPEAETSEADAPEQRPEAEGSEQEAAEDGSADQGEDGSADEAPEEEAGEPTESEQASEGEEAGAAADEALEGLDWKARRRLQRSRVPAEARPPQSPGERAKARAERRAGARKVRASYRRKRREKEAGGGTGTPPAEGRSVGRKVRQGTVVSDRADKTITVRIDVARRHPVYEKIVRSSNTLHAHDERNEANQGDLVRIVETRPISRHKRWRLVEVLEKAK